MKEALAGLFSSKKAIAAMAGTVASVLIVFAGKQGWMIDPAAAKILVMAVLGLAGLYIGGQAGADWGKEAAKVQAAAAQLLETSRKLPAPPESPEREVLTEDV